MTIERLSPDDRLLLLSDEVWPQDVGAILILDGRGGGTVCELTSKRRSPVSFRTSR